MNAETMPRIENITVRKGLPQDSRLLSALGRETFSDSFAADNRPEDMAAYLKAAFSSGKQAAELADPMSVFLIAEVGGEPAGYVRLLRSAPPLCIRARHPIQLVRIYAHRQWIGHGVGPALMRASIAQARQRRCDGIWLGVWAKNDRAIRFYHKWGFCEAGTQPFQLGRDHQTDLVLWRSLEEPAQSTISKPQAGEQVT